MTSFPRIFISFAVLAFTQGQHDNASSPATAGASDNNIPSSSSSTTTTQSPPSSSTSPVPTTTRAPPPPATAAINGTVPTWTVRSSYSSCVLVSGNFSFAVTYTDDSSENSVSEKLDIPANATVSGSCGPFLNTLVLTWSVTSSQGNLTFMFIKKPIYDAGVDTGEGSYSLTVIFGRLTVGNPNGNGTTGNNYNGSNRRATNSGGHTFLITVREPDFMSTPLHNSFSCESYQSLPADPSRNVYLEMRNVQLEAFHDGPAREFSSKNPCSKDIFSSVMSNVGYVAIALLVAAVVGYLGWKKFGRAGYTEV